MSQNNGELSVKKNKKKIIIIIAAVIFGLCLICLAIGFFLEGLEAVGLRATRTPKPAATNTTEPISTNTIEPTDTLEPTSTPEPTSTTEPTFTPEPTATENPFMFTSGTYLVNSELEPGIYKGEAGDDIWDSCYWERLSDLSGDFDSIITNENSMGNFYVEIKDTDFAFTVNCPITHIDGVPEPEEFLTKLDIGIYIIGRDIQPGLYKGQAGEDIMDSCYWARLRGVSGEFGEIIANDNATGQFYIQVAPTDFALQVSCSLQFQSE
jgi:hypothetical protein